MYDKEKEIKTMTYTITNNPQFNSLEITFDGKPSEEIRNALKALKFRWHNVKKCWYGYSTEEAAKAAIEGRKPPRPNASPRPKRKTNSALKSVTSSLLLGDGNRPTMISFRLSPLSVKAP